MSNFTKQFAEEVPLPDGSVASSVADVDKYLKTSGLALSSDFSAEYIQNIRLKNEQQRQKEIFAEFLNNYKRMIWK